MKLSFRHLLMVVLMAGIASAQVATGNPPFGSFGGGPFDTVNLGNLNVHFAIPVVHKAGRGMPFTYDLSYDSSIWLPVSTNGVAQWQPVYNWGWRGSTEAQAGYMSYTTGSNICYYTIRGIKYPGSTDLWQTNYVYHDAWGVPHPFAGTSNVWTGNGDGGCTLGTNNSVTSTTTDGSGYTLYANFATNTTTITSRHGKIINPPAGDGIGTATSTDSNGNQITVSSSGVFTDTLGTTALTVSGVAPNPIAFKYPAPPNGASNVSYTMNYKEYTVQTAFGLSTVQEYGPVKNALVSSIQLPDGSSYQFSYEAGPSSCVLKSGTTSCVTGRITQVTLPSGGTITNTYSNTGGTNNTGIFSDGSTAGLTRMLSPTASCSPTQPSGCWEYTRTLQNGTPGSGSSWQTSVADPYGNYTVIDTTEDAATATLATYYFYETQRQVYQGSVSSNNLLLTTIHCYNGNYANCSAATTTVSSPITQIDAYTELPTTTAKIRLSEITYNTFGLVTGDKEYDYGVALGSAPSSTYLLANTTTSYYAPSNGIASMVQQVITKDRGGNTKASASYTFDGATLIQTPLCPANGCIPQHVSVTGARGNLTTVVTQGSAAYLYRQYTYYDTGTLNNATNLTTSSTATCANSPSICTTYNYSSTNNASCGDSFPTSISEPMSLSVSMQWSCTGGVLTQTKDLNQNATNYTYGDANYWRVTNTSFPDGGSTSTTYNFGTNSPWNITASVAEDSSHNVSGETVLDEFGRVVQTQATSDPSNNIDYVDTVYDAIGRVSSVSNTYQTTSDPTYGITQYSYDALNRTIKVTHPDSTYATFTYTGAATQVVDEGNGSTQVQRVYQNDGLGRLTSVCEATSQTQLGSSNTPGACGQDIAATGFLTSHGYDALGNLTSVTQGSLTRSYTYDYLSRLTQEVNPESGTTTYSYDTGTAGNLYQRTRPKPNQTGSATVVTTYTFDNLNRPTVTSYNDGSTPSVTLSYDQSSVSGVSLSNYLGNLTNAVAANGTAGTIFSYDTMNRVAKNWQCTPLNCGTGNFSLTFLYDYLGDVTSLTNSQENVTYTYSYDTLARSTKLQSSLSDSNHPGTLVTVNTYNPLGEVTKATLGNGIVRNMVYDNRGRMTSLADGSIYSFTLGYAPDSNIVTGNDYINGNWSYTYDGFNRISTANNSSNQQSYTYAYDRYSNRWQQNSNPSYVFNSNNQISGSGVVYDAAGNVTADGLGNTYTYDAENRVIQVNGTAGQCSTATACYVYDALGQRVRATINSTSYDFIYNGGRAIDEVAASGWVWGDAGGSQLAVYSNSPTSTTYFNHSDWLGSVRAWSNVSGASVGTSTNLPFGDGQTNSGTMANLWHYTGLPEDTESGLTHALFRQLSTTQGRWMTSDPAGLAAVDPTNPQSWNRYAYVNNTPTNAVDPLGLYCPVPGPLDNPFWTLPASQVHCNPYAPGPLTGWFAQNDNSFGGGGFSVGVSGMPCDSDFMPCGLPMPGLYQSIWDALGLPTGLNCPQTGGVFGPLCGGISPIMDAQSGSCVPTPTSGFGPHGVTLTYNCGPPPPCQGADFTFYACSAGCSFRSFGYRLREHTSCDLGYSKLGTTACRDMADIRSAEGNLLCFSNCFNAWSDRCFGDDGPYIYNGPLDPWPQPK
jgi:RHS repeat-associated protein